MNTGEDEPSTGLNGRLRPRKSNHSPQSNQISRKSENKILLDKPKRTTNLKILPNKTDDLVNKSDNTIPKHFCPYCDKTFISKQTALKHVHLIHISSSKQDFFFDCLFCNHVEHNSNIIRHMVDSHPNQYFACLDCHTRFPSTSDVAQHKLNVCEKQKLSYRSKLRQKSLESKKSKKLSKSDVTKSILSNKKDFTESFNGIVISCELKPTKVHDDADIEDNITTNLILPSNKGISHKAVMEKNAIIVLDDIQWNKRIPSNFSFHNTDADQILTRLGVVHRSPRTGESTIKEWTKPSENGTHKFEKCFDTSFYMQVTSNVQENLLKHLDGSFNDNPEPDSFIKTRKSKDCVPINTAEGFPILLAGEQYSRNQLEGFVPRAIAPKHKWKWDSADNGRDILNMVQLKRDSHLNNCIITYVSNLDIWTQLCMRKKFEDKFSSLPLEKKTEERNTISKELKEILESKEIPTSSTQGFKNFGKPTSTAGFHFPAMLGLTPTIQPFVLPPAVLSGESVRPRCYVCCACGEQTHDSRALSSHISTEHPNAQIEHYEIVGEPLLNADIFKHLYVPPSQIFNRTRPQRGFRECTKCKKSVSLEDLHQHMLDCAGDTPTVRRKCRYRPFGVRKRRPRLPDNRIRKKMRKDIRTGQRNDKNILRTRPKTRSEVGDAETIRKMLADLPAKRHRVTVNPLNSFPRRKYDRKRNKIMTKKHSLDQKYMNIDKVSDKKIISSGSTTDSKDSGFNNDDDDEDDNLPLRPKTRDSSISSNSNHKKESLNKKAIMNRPKRKPKKELKLVIENATEALSRCIESTEPDKISLDNPPNRVDLNSDPQKVRGHSNREGSNNRESQQSGSSGPSGNSNNSNAPTQNVPLKHSIASLTADSETHDKAVQFHRLFLVQQECNNGDEHHFPSDPHILFENQAVVTKLDKPPLHFNQNRASDVQYSRKNKLSKPRKGLNDCIAMLKNKLTPNIDSDIPGHVSVQCGSDEPIELEPIYIEQGFHFIGSKHGYINKEISQPHISADDKPAKTSDGNDYGNSHESIIDVICPDKDKVQNYHIQDRLSDQCQDKINPRENNAPNDVVIPTTQLALLPPPRNTVIHKSPKMSGNQIQQEEENMISKSQIPKNNKNIDQNEKASEIPSIMSKDILKTIIRPGVRNSQYCNEVTKKDALVDFTRNNNLTNLTPNNDLIPLNLNLAKNLTKSQNQYVSTKRTEWNKRTGKNTVEQNGESSLKINLQHASDKYNDIPLKILPAHTSASFEPLSPAPLDLSGKSVSADTSQNSSHQGHTLIMNRYDDYETLDLSNKNTDDNETLENSTVMEDVSLDVVVDLSIKQTPQSSSQSSPTNLSTKSPENNENSTGTVYDKIHEDFPTDLSLRKRARASSINILPQECVAIDYIQDLSNHKPVHKGRREENMNVLDHINNEAPRDLSNRGLEDNSIVTNLLTNETESRDMNIVSNTLEASEKHENENIVYDNSAESLLSNSNEDINLNVPKRDSNYILPSTNTESTISHSQNQLSPFKDNMNNVNSSDINETIGSGNLPQSHTEPTNTGERNETINSQSSQPFIETICFIVPKDQLPYEIENSTLNITITTNGDSVPLYQSLNCNGTTQEARNNPESTTSVYSLENVISTSDLDETNFSNNPEEKISSSSSVYNEVETDKDDKINYNPNNVLDVNKNEKSLILRNNNSAETNTIAEYTSELSTATPDKKYDLTKEIINCEAEQDTETARKIAMLPQELVEILGTMPIDHRNQLLNVLPQYVSTSASTTGTETRKCLIKKQQDLSKERSYDERLSDIKNLTRAVESDKILYPTSTVLSPESVPKSVILKAPVVLNENYQKTSKTCDHEYSSTFTIKRNSTPVHKRQPKLVNFEDEANVVIDLTHDENVQEVKKDIQIIESDVVPLSHDFDKNQNIDTSVELLKQKGNNDKTANLRAVRIKTTYERNKLIPLEGSLEYKGFYKNTNDKDQITEISGYEDVNAENNGIKTYNEDLRIAEDRIEIPPSQSIDSNKSFDHLNENITLSGPLNVNESILVNSTVILTPISNKENSIVLPDITFERVTNRQSNDLSNSMGEEITLLDTTDEHDNRIQMIPINGDALPTPPKVSKEKVAIGDEDSEDDVTLAVIVKKKQQMQLPASCDNIPLLQVKCTVTDNNNVKQDKKTIKSVLKDKDSKQLPDEHLGAVKLSATFDDIDNLTTVESEMRNGKHRNNSNSLNTCKNSSIEMVVSNCKLTKNIRSRRVSSKFSKAKNQRKRNGSIISQKKGGNMTIKTKDLQKVYKEDTLNIHTIVNGSTLKLDTKDCTVQNNIVQSQTKTDVKENQSSNKNHDVCIDKTKLNVNSPQISQQSSKENIQKLKGKRDNPRKKKCFVRNCILHSYMGNLYRKSLYNSKQRIAPHLQAVCTGVPISKIKELTRLKQKRNKQRSEIIKSQQTSIGTEKINPLPLRRSRRGKSMFVDNNSAQSYVSQQNDKPSEQKVPLTKKQLIFSKLLLDEERILQPQTDEVIAKAPVILIKDVSISGHTLSPISQNNKNTNESEQSTVNALIQDKRPKRKKSPQSKQKYKKIKSVDGDTEYNTLSTNKTEIQKGKTEKQISQEDESFLSQNALSTSLLTEQNKNNEEFITNGNGSAIQTVYSEKRKICTSTNADNNRYSESKKSKLTDDNGTENNKLEHVKQNIVENWRKSRNDTETKNTTCYNSHTAMRRTRSKSVVVKSNTPLYDPYDIDLEDMAEKDESFGRLITSNKAFSKSSFVRDQRVKKINKNETSVGVNTEPIIEENKDLIATKKLNEAYSKEDTSDSDDSAKSDVPLQKYVEEREKKKSRHNSTTEANSSAQDSQKKKKETQIVASTSNEQQNRNEQFMESFGFFSERKPRKSNLIAAKKISETFNAIEADDTNDDEKVQPSSKQQPETTKPNDDENASAEPTQAVTKKPAKRGRKKASKPVTKFCVICNKDFKRPDNYLRHQITLLHISKLSEIEMKVKTTPVFEEPNYLIPYKQQLDHLKMIGMAKKKRNVKPPSKAPLPTLGEILAKVNKKVRNQQLSRRNLSRDEALFIDCCELLQESHKPELSNNTEQITTIISTTIEQTPVVSNNLEQATTVPTSAEQVIISNSNDEAVTSQNNEQVILLNEVNTVVTERAAVIESDKENNTISEEYELRSDGDVDSITAKNILESEEVRNLENDLLSGLKEAAAQSLAHASSNFVLQQTLSGIQSDQNETEQEALSSPVLVNKNCENIECHEVVSEPPKKIPKPRRKQEVTDSMYPNVFEDINMFEDKFDKIKRKCRSQAAAAKHAQPVVEPITSQKGKKKSENIKGNEPSKEDPCHAIPTKGALKGFDGLKVSTPTSGINTSAIIPPLENTSKGKKKNNSRNHKDTVEIVTQSKPNQDHRLKTTQTQKIDVYEFMDSEDTELFDFRPSTIMERFKNNSNRDMPNTSKFVSTTDEVSCESGSDGDDFVYDDYVCSDDETENSIMSCELGNSKTGIETKSKSNSPLKRKDAVEKSAVMGKIFKHNAVRTERKNIKIVDNSRPQANLDQLFDSLLVADPGVPSVNTKLPKKESREQDSTPSSRHVSKSSKKHGHSKRHESSKKHEISKKHDTSKNHDSFKKHEASKKYELSKIHESCKIEEFSKKHESSHKYDSPKKHVSSKKHTSPKKHASSKKHESSKKHGYSRKHESSKKHQYSKTQETPKKHGTSKEYQSTSHRKHQSASGYDEVFQRKDEDESPSKHGVKMSKQYSGKSNASASYDTTNIDVYNDGNINSVHLIFNCKPSTSKDYNYESVQEIVQSSPKKHISHKRTKSSLNEYHSSTPKSLGVLRSCKESFHQPTNIYLNVRSERRSREITSSNRDSILVHNRDSGPSDLYTNHFGRYTRNRSTTPEIEEDNDSNSDIMDTLDEATSDDAGVARQRARRKCTVGKQNILAETWSSESEPESGPPRPNSAESEASGGVRKKGKKKRDGPYGNRRGVSRQMPILRQDLESRVALFKRTTTSSAGRGIQGSSSGAGPSSAPVTSIVPSSSVAGGSAGPSGSSRSHHSRSATSLWSTEGDEEQEHHQQHGWIVGVSHKKLVTMLAHAKGRKRNHDDKRHNVE